MTLEDIYDDIRNGEITFGPHLVQRMWEDGISIDQVLDVILNGTVNKRKKDERSQGQFMKFTISKRGIMVVVKDCKPSFIITAKRRGR